MSRKERFIKALKCLSFQIGDRVSVNGRAGTVIADDPVFFSPLWKVIFDDGATLWCSFSEISILT